MEALNATSRFRLFPVDFEFQTLAYSLFSPISTRIAVYHSNGTLVAGTSLSPVDTLSASTYQNYDAAWVATHSLPVDDYVIEVSPSTLSPTAFPEGGTSLDATSFFGRVG